MSLHEIGKTTLETYLMQHHIWLTSNAKTLLTIVPDHPWINFALATILFFFVSRELYRLTMSLRGMILPDDKVLAMRNILATSGLFTVLLIVAAALYYSKPGIADIIIAISSLFICVILLINRFSSSVYTNSSFQNYSTKFCALAAVCIIVGLVLQLSEPGLPASSALYSYIPHKDKSRRLSDSSSSADSFNTKKCYQSLCRGHWDTKVNAYLSIIFLKELLQSTIFKPYFQECDLEDASATAMCQLEIWDWEESDCPIKVYFLLTER